MLQTFFRFEASWGWGNDDRTLISLNYSRRTHGFWRRSVAHLNLCTWTLYVYYVTYTANAMKAWRTKWSFTNLSNTHRIGMITEKILVWQSSQTCLLSGCVCPDEISHNAMLLSFLYVGQGLYELLTLSLMAFVWMKLKHNTLPTWATRLSFIDARDLKK